MAAGASLIISDLTIGPENSWPDPSKLLSAVQKYSVDAVREVLRGEYESLLKIAAAIAEQNKNFKFALLKYNPGYLQQMISAKSAAIEEYQGKMASTSSDDTLRVSIRPLLATLATNLSHLQTLASYFTENPPDATEKEKVAQFFRTLFDTEWKLVEFASGGTESLAELTFNVETALMVIAALDETENNLPALLKCYKNYIEGTGLAALRPVTPTVDTTTLAIDTQVVPPSSGSALVSPGAASGRSVAGRAGPRGEIVVSPRARQRFSPGARPPPPTTSLALTSPATSDPVSAHSSGPRTAAAFFSAGTPSTATASIIPDLAHTLTECIAQLMRTAAEVTKLNAETTAHNAGIAALLARTGQAAGAAVADESTVACAARLARLPASAAPGEASAAMPPWAGRSVTKLTPEQEAARAMRAAQEKQRAAFTAELRAAVQARGQREAAAPAPA